MALISTYRPDIDGLRAFAIISVVLYHAFPSLFSGGFVGVDVFFVISGFLISTIIFRGLNEGEFNFVKFYARRINRILPALLTVLTVFLVAGWFLLFSSEYSQLGKHVAAGAGFILNVVLTDEAGYFDVASEKKPLLHLWSLAVEEQFYLIYPVLVWAIWKSKFNNLAFLFAIGGLSFSTNVLGHYPQIDAYYATQCRFWELIIGSILAYWLLNTTTNPQYGCNNKLSRFLQHCQPLNSVVLFNVLGGMGLFFLFFSVFGIDKGITFSLGWAILPTFGAFLLILAGPQSWVNRKLLGNNLMIFIGLISYPLYLWHWPILSFIRITQFGDIPWLVRIAGVVLSLFLAWLTYALIERPIRNGQTGLIKICSLSFLMLFVGMWGFAVYKGNGLQYRAIELSVMADQVEPLSPFKVNLLGRPPNATVMLLGDSHASHLAGGLVNLNQKITNYTHGGCIPFYNVDRFDINHRPGHCRKWINEAIEVFESSDKMTTIILASMGQMYLTGDSFMRSNDNRVKGLKLTISNHPDIKDPWQIYEIGLRETIDRILKKNKKIIYILDVPELGFDPMSCIPHQDRPLQFLKPPPPPEPCAVSKETVEIRSGAFRSMVARVLKDYPAVVVFDAAKPLCDEKWCWAKKGGQLLYVDYDHLSLDGGALIGQSLNPLIRQVAAIE